MGIRMRPMRLAIILAAVQSGCQYSNYAQRGAGLGGVTGAGVGALVGEAAADNPLAGAAIGAGVGTLVGAATGGAFDDIEAQNQALIQQQLGRQLAGTTSLEDVVAMSQSGLGDEVIRQHLRTHGLAASLSANDLIALKQQGVSDGVIRGMQEATAGGYVAQASAAVPVNPPVIVEEHYYGPPMPYRPYWRYRHPRTYPHTRHHQPGLHWGVSFGN